MKLKKLLHEPPSGWVYNTVCMPGMEKIIYGENWYDLLEQVRSYYRINEFELPLDIEDQIQDQICSRNPPEFCIGSHRKKWITIQQLKEGTQAIKEMMAGHTVPKEEAERRAMICVGCDHNINYHGCLPCVIADTGADFAGLKTSMDKRLRSCELCGCMLRVKVFADNSVLEKLSKQDYPDFCWLAGK